MGDNEGSIGVVTLMDDLMKEKETMSEAGFVPGASAVLQIAQKAGYAERVDAEKITQLKQAG